MSMKRLYRSAWLCIVLTPAITFASETRPPLAWQDTIREEIEVEVTELEPQLLLGGAIATQHYFRNGKYYGLPINDEQRKAVAAFEAFMAGEGEALKEKLLDGEPLTGEEAKYTSLVNAYLISEAFRGKRKPDRRKPDWKRYQVYADKIKEEGQRLLKHAYRGGEWSRDDLETVRRYIFWMDAKCTMAPILPHELGLSTKEEELEPGNLPPPLTAAHARAYWDRPGYSDLSPFDFRYAFLPGSMHEVFNILAGLELNEGQEPVHKTRLGLAGVSGEDIFDLASWKGKKPVMLVFAGPTDAWNWHGKLIPYLQVLDDHYGDQVEIVLIATTVHDAIMGSRDFFGPNVTNRAKMPAPHPATIEERARRVKMFYLNYPQISLDYYLDNINQTIRDTFRDQGGGAFVLLINKDGTIAAKNRERNVWPHTRPKPQSTWHDLPDILHVRANQQEQALQAMLNNQGQLPDDFRFAYDKIARADLLWDRHALWLTGTVKTVDADTVTVLGEVDADEIVGYHLWKANTLPTERGGTPVDGNMEVLDRWIETENSQPERTFILQPKTTVTLNGRHAKLADLRPGDKIAVFYQTRYDSAGTQPALQIRATRL